MRPHRNFCSFGRAMHAPARAQAFGRDDVIARDQLKPFTRRNNHMGLLYLVGHFALLGGTGWLVYITYGTWWMLPAMFLHGVVMTFLFAPMHETSHGTAFRNLKLNEAVFWLVSFIYISPPIFFRHFHAAHHSYTQIRGSDPDIVLPERPTLRNYVYYCSALRFWRRNMGWFFNHALGRIDPRDAWYIPEAAKPQVVAEARLMVAIYGAIALVAIALGRPEPLFYWIIPRIMGEPVMRWIRVTEHSGCEESPDLRKNTRTTRAGPLFKALFWNMPYHAEHHLSPSVPFFALRAFHEEIGHKLHPIGAGYFAIHGEVLRIMRAGEHLSPSQRKAA